MKLFLAIFLMLCTLSLPSQTVQEQKAREREILIETIQERRRELDELDEKVRKSKEEIKRLIEEVRKQMSVSRRAVNRMTKPQKKPEATKELEPPQVAIGVEINAASLLIIDTIPQIQPKKIKLLKRLLNKKRKK